MNGEELGKLLVAIVKANGGTVALTTLDLDIKPTESIQIEQYTDGSLLLTYKDQQVIDG